MSIDNKDFSKILKPGDKVFISKYGCRKKRTLYAATVKTVGKVHITLNPITPGVREMYRLDGNATVSGDDRYHSGTFWKLVEATPEIEIEYRKQQEIKFIRDFTDALSKVDLDAMPVEQRGALYKALRKAEDVCNGRYES